MIGTILPFDPDIWRQRHIHSGFLYHSFSKVALEKEMDAR